MKQKKKKKHIVLIFLMRKPWLEQTRHFPGARRLKAAAKTLTANSVSSHLWKNLAILSDSCHFQRYFLKLLVFKYLQEKKSLSSVRQPGLRLEILLLLFFLQCPCSGFILFGPHVFSDGHSSKKKKNPSLTKATWLIWLCVLLVIRDACHSSCSCLLPSPVWNAGTSLFLPFFNFKNGTSVLLLYLKAAGIQIKVCNMHVLCSWAEVASWATGWELLP